MIASKSLLAGIFAVSVCVAQTQSVNISGKVTDTGGTPIAGAIVKLVNAGLTATSGSDGSFALSGTVGVHKQNTQLKQQESVVTIGNGCLRVNIPNTSAVEISAYTLQGKAISKTRTLMDAGTHSITLPRIGAGVYLYKLKVGNNEFTTKSALIDGISRETSSSLQNRSSDALTKKARSADAFTDAILATKTGYLSFLRRVTNSDIGNMEIVIKMTVGSGLFVFGLQRQIVMKDIPAGTFTMGSSDSLDRYDAQPPHQVTLSAFRMQETDVTQEQYLTVMGTNPSYFDTGTDASLRPVDLVSWYDAVQYCNALSKLAGLDTCYRFTFTTDSNVIYDFSKTGFRLPTEAQWEYACRAGSTTEYWWGPDTNGMGARMWWNFATDPGTQAGLSPTYPVATKLANAYGLYDMTGMDQWCNDWYGAYSEEAETDPTGPVAGGSWRILRGGPSGINSDSYFRSADREYDYPDVRNCLDFGFRVVLPR